MFYYLKMRMVKSKEYLLQIIKNGADKKQIDVKTPIEVAI